MDEQQEVWLNGLADALEVYQSRIVDRWMQTSEADGGLVVISKLTREEFRNNIPAALAGLGRVLRQPSAVVTEAIRAEVSKHGHHRWKQGFSLRELIRDWGHLNRALLAEVEVYIQEHSAPNVATRQEAFDRLAAYVTEAMSQSVVRFDELRETEAEALARDLESTRAAFDQLSEARATLLHEVTHDLGGSLSAVELTAGALKKRAAVDDTFVANLQTLEESIRSVREMFDSMLDLARLESGRDEVEWEETDVSISLQRLVEECRVHAREKGLELQTEGPASLRVRTDSRKVRRITQNLLLNALQQTRQGHVRVVWEKGEHCWLLHVEDTGPGLQEREGSPVARELDEEDHADPPAAPPTAGYQGEGIGLTIVKRLCEKLGAGITIESERGNGTVFTVQFPVETPKT